MMRFFRWMEEGTKRLGLWDVAFLKWSAVIFGLFLAKLFPILMEVNIWIYLGLSVLLWLKPGCAFFCKNCCRKDDVSRPGN